MLGQDRVSITLLMSNERTITSLGALLLHVLLLFSCFFISACRGYLGSVQMISVVVSVVSLGVRMYPSDAGKEARAWARAQI